MIFPIYIKAHIPLKNGTQRKWNQHQQKWNVHGGLRWGKRKFSVGPNASSFASQWNIGLSFDVNEGFRKCFE